MAAPLCDECTLFKERFESLSQHDDEDAHRTPFPNLASLEESALSGCSLCQIIYQSWHNDRNSSKYKSSIPINATGEIWTKYDPEDDSESIKQRVFIHNEGENHGFCLASFEPGEIGKQAFCEYQNASRHIIEPDATDSISKIVSMASKWLQNCRQTHQNCGSVHFDNEPKLLPTRLIDVGTGSLDQPAKVFVPLRHLQSLEYIALSYAWGSASKFTKTTSSNLEAMTQCLPSSQLPKTIRDAIVITRSLGIRYLWVDALCILQSEGQDDAKHKEDWSYEAARFGQYYENALLTLAATGASSSDDGLLLARPVSRFEPKPITFRPGKALSYTVRARIPSWHTETNDAPLLCRGWAVQERFLSRRVLHFANNMILWECHDCRATEIDPHGLNPIGPEPWVEIITGFMTMFRDLRINGLEPDDFTDEWYSFIQDYSRQGFTFVSDRLPALSGIASIIQRRTQQKYVAGLWESTIPEGLAWMTSGSFRFGTSPLLGSQLADEPDKPDAQLELPSWCWAASRGYLRFAKQAGWLSMLQVEAWKIQSRGEDTSGQLRGGRLTVRGFCGVLNLSDLGFVFHPDDNLGDHVLGRDPQNNLFDYSQIVFMDTAVGPEVRNVSHPCLLIGSTQVLNMSFEQHVIGGAIILQPTGRCLGTTKEYRRIGFICLPVEECLSILHAEMMTLDLV